MSKKPKIEDLQVSLVKWKKLLSKTTEERLQEKYQSKIVSCMLNINRMHQRGYM